MAARLTPQQRAALTAATHGEIRHRHGHPWPHHPGTLASLTTRRLLTRTQRRDKHAHQQTIWTITDAGRHTLNPPPKPKTHQPQYLAPTKTGHDYTTQPHRSIDTTPQMGALETINPDQLNHTPAKTRHIATQPTRRHKTP